MTTTGSDERNDPVRPVIDDELVDRLMAQVDAEGLELLGPDGVLTELTPMQIHTHVTCHRRASSPRQ